MQDELLFDKSELPYNIYKMDQVRYAFGEGISR